MKILRNGRPIGGPAAVGAVPVMGQVQQVFSPGTIWTVTIIQITSGMDQITCSISTPRPEVGGRAGEGRLPETVQDSPDVRRQRGGNLLILRDYVSLAAVEANVEKADALSTAVGRHRPGADAGLSGPQQVSRGRRHEVGPRADAEIGDPTGRSGRLRTAAASIRSHCGAERASAISAAHSAIMLRPSLSGYAFK